MLCFFFFKQKTAYEIKECDWSSDVCSSDLSGKCKSANKRTGHINSGGYICNMISGKRQLEHRGVMEKFIGRNLSKSECVHHINGDKLDNRIEKDRKSVV